MTVIITAKLEISTDEITASLHREATKLSDEGNLKVAIECLKKAQERMIEQPTYWPIESWLRLPLYLQKDGRYDEAIAQFNWLLEKNNEWVSTGFKHQPVEVRKKLAASVKSKIEQKIELAKRREQKRLDKTFTG